MTNLLINLQWAPTLRAKARHPPLETKMHVDILYYIYILLSMYTWVHIHYVGITHNQTGKQRYKH